MQEQILALLVGAGCRKDDMRTPDVFAALDFLEADEVGSCVITEG